MSLLPPIWIYLCIYWHSCWKFSVSVSTVCPVIDMLQVYLWISPNVFFWGGVGVNFSPGGGGSPCALVAFVSLPSCPISVCPLSSVWLLAGVSAGPVGCGSAHFSSPVHIEPTTALAPVKSRLFVFSVRRMKPVNNNVTKLSWPSRRLCGSGRFLQNIKSNLISR